MNTIDEKFYINKSPYLDAFDFAYGTYPLSDAAVATYVALRSIQGSNQKKRMYVTAQEICFELYGNTKGTRTDIEKIRSGLEQLEEVGYISIEESNEKSWYVLDVSNLYEDDTNLDYHCLLYRHEVWSIFSKPIIYDCYTLLRYFLCIIGSINTNASIRSRSTKEIKKNFVGMMSIQYLAQVAGITETTAFKYNAILSGLELIHFERSNVYQISKSGEQKTLPAHYGRWRDKDDVIEFARLESAKYKDSATFIKKAGLADIQKSLTMKYHALENGTVYSEDEMYDMVAIMAARNQFFGELADEASKETTKKKLLGKVKKLPLLSEWAHKRADENPDEVDKINAMATAYYNIFLRERPKYEKNIHENPKNTERQKDALSTETEMGKGKTEVRDRTFESEARQLARKNGRKQLEFED